VSALAHAGRQERPFGSFHGLLQLHTHLVERDGAQVVRVLKVPDAIRDVDASDMRSVRTRAFRADRAEQPSLGPPRLGRAAARVVAAGSREKLPVVDLGAVNEDVRVRVGGGAVQVGLEDDREYHSGNGRDSARSWLLAVAGSRGLHGGLHAVARVAVLARLAHGGLRVRARCARWEWAVLGSNQ
jgi:hypothetical protein